MNISVKRALTLALNFTTIISTGLLHGQSSTFESGRPFIINFSPKEYHAEAQNWDIAQDSKGLLYFGNSGGVLQFDGNQWQLINQLPDGITDCLYHYFLCIQYPH